MENTFTSNVYNCLILYTDDVNPRTHETYTFGYSVLHLYIVCLKDDF